MKQLFHLLKNLTIYLLTKLVSIPAEVSLNLSLVFFFLHFQGLKILPMVESFPFLLKGRVCEPAVGPSEFAMEALSSPSTV